MDEFILFSKPIPAKVESKLSGFSGTRPETSTIARMSLGSGRLVEGYTFGHTYHTELLYYSCPSLSTLKSNNLTLYSSLFQVSS